MNVLKRPNVALELEDGSRFEGVSFGAPVSASGEVVFNTGMVGYPESLTDPSYSGQILTLTYPLIGNYGVPSGCHPHPGPLPSKGRKSSCSIDRCFESGKIQISGLIVSEISNEHSHWNSAGSLSAWLAESNIPGIAGIDTRALTKILREKGTMLGKIIVNGTEIEQKDPDKTNLVAEVSCRDVLTYGDGQKTVVLVDCGCKNNIIISLLARGLKVVRVPWDHDLAGMDYDGLFISNGPGNPVMCDKTIQNLRVAMEKKKPIFGICLGNQLLALAGGGSTYKLKYGHRSQNQPCVEVGTKRCYITSQNHGYAVDAEKMPAGWEVWFKNANDGTVEGMRHKELPFMSVQFHPEAKPGPTDTAYLFDRFAEML